MQRTALYEEHLTLGARMVDFAGWEMPVQYAGVIEEHRAVRTGAGLFDLGHMGEIRVSGPSAGAALDYALISTPSALLVGRAQYSMIVNEAGGILDDLVVYRIADAEWLVVANASNRHAVLVAMQDMADYGFKIDIFDETEDWALVAIQGPKAKDILGKLVDVDLSELKYYSIAKANLDGVPVLLARTGYTGEDGFEIFIPVLESASIWRKLLATGGEDLLPCGLAARDTLRLEAGMPLYGHELDRTLTPFEANLGRIVVFDKGEFNSKTELLKVSNQKLEVKLFGLKGEGKRAARADYEIFQPGGETSIGKITSGVLSPTLGYPIAMAYLRADLDLTPGSKLEADVRGTRVPYEIVKLPFYKAER